MTRNHGSGNGGRFIALKNGANEGIVPPTFSSAAKTSAERIRGGTQCHDPRLPQGQQCARRAAVFPRRSQSRRQRQLESDLPHGPGETIIAATQTKEGGGTSELSTATVPATPTTGGGGEGSGGGGNNNGPPPITDTKAPTATITKGPKAQTTSTTAKFKFKSNEAGSTFQCKLDKGKFKKCKSPKTYKKLKPGKHVFKVRATDKAGNVGKPATKKFKILTG